MDGSRKKNLSHKSGKKKGKETGIKKVDFRGKARRAGTYTATIVTYCVDRK
jgi:hypothetical protein